MRTASAASPTTSGTSCVVEPAVSKPSRASSLRSASALACSLSTRCGCSSSSSRAASAPAAAGGGGAVRAQQRARAAGQEAGGRRVAGDVGAVGAQRLAERADDHVDLVLEARLGDGAAAGRAQAADAVGLVDDEASAVAAGELDELLQRRDVAVGGEDRVGGDDAGAGRRRRPAAPRGAPCRRGRYSCVWAPASAQPSRSDCVAELVAQQQRAAARRARRRRRARPGSRSRTAAPPRCCGRRPAAPRGGGGSSSCPRPRASRPPRRPSASPRRPPPRAPADGRRGPGSWTSTAAARACRRARRAGPAVRSPGACGDRGRAP